MLENRRGKDTAEGKATLVELLGKDAARRERDAAVLTAKTAIENFGEKADVLRQIADFVAHRRH